MAQPSSVAREPSMEEILASIRRIIEDSEPVTRAADPEFEMPANGVAPAADEAEAFRAELAIPGHEPQEAQAPRAPVDPRAQAERIQAERPRSMADIHAAIRKEAPPAAQVHPLRPAEPMKPAAAAAAPRVEARQEAARPAAEAPRPSQPATATQPQPQPQAHPQPQPQHELRAEQRPKPVDSQIAAEVESVAAILRPAVDAPQVAPAPRQQPTQTISRPEVQRGMLISDRSGKQVTASFGELAEAYQTIRKRSLADAAEEMMKPMLQSWLDNNLPRIVERLVREEIERVARGEAH
jgi:cell pole-organizing protein PopZ